MICSTLSIRDPYTIHHLSSRLSVEGVCAHVEHLHLPAALSSFSISSGVHPDSEIWGNTAGFGVHRFPPLPTASQFTTNQRPRGRPPSAEHAVLCRAEKIRSLPFFRFDDSQK